MTTYITVVDVNVEVVYIHSSVIKYKYDHNEVNEYQEYCISGYQLFGNIMYHYKLKRLALFNGYIRI